MNSGDTGVVDVARVVLSFPRHVRLPSRVHPQWWLDRAGRRPRDVQGGGRCERGRDAGRQKQGVALGDAPCPAADAALVAPASLGDRPRRANSAPPATAATTSSPTRSMPAPPRWRAWGASLAVTGGSSGATGRLCYTLRPGPANAGVPAPQPPRGGYFAASRCSVLMPRQVARRRRARSRTALEKVDSLCRRRHAQ